MTHSIVLLVIYALAVLRICRLVIDDAITAPWRDSLMEWAHIGKIKTVEMTRSDKLRRSLWTLASCYYCLSVWVAAVVTLLAYFGGFWWSWVCAALALSQVTGYLAERS